MKTRILLSVTVVAGLTVLSVSAQTTDPLIGVWKQNLAKSIYNPGPPPPLPAIRTWEIHNDGYRVTEDFVNPQSQQTHTVTVVKFDGKEYPVSGAVLPTTRAYFRVDDRTYERVTRVNGSVTQKLRVLVSADGRTRTSTETQPKTSDRPAQNNVLIYEKQ